MTRLTDDLLKIIAEGSGRVYNHEAKKMAQELIERRKAEAAAQLAKTQPIPNPFAPFP